ncbi:hypothetical protein L345_02314, partial [Ophiophagus hannah]
MAMCCFTQIFNQRRLKRSNPKSQEPVTLDFLDAELENDIKVEFVFGKVYVENDFGCLVQSLLALVLPSYSFYYIKAKINETLTQAKWSDTLGNGLVMRALLDAGFTSDLVQNYWSKQDP